MASAQLLSRGMHFVRHRELAPLLATIAGRLFPFRNAIAASLVPAVDGRVGLEIGGPSRIFQYGGALPVYGLASRVDGVNFALSTLWESSLRDGGEYFVHPRTRPGRQFICEAVRLRGVADGSYDFVISSHCLEHIANPLLALREWRRVVRPGGAMIVALPDPRLSFDNRRPITSFDHLQRDFATGMEESDLSHLEEIRALHNLGRDPDAGTPDDFARRAARNLENRGLHHHVFDLALLRTCLQHCGWEVTDSARVRFLHLVALTRNPG